MQQDMIPLEAIGTARPLFEYSDWLRAQDLEAGIIHLDESIRESMASRILTEIAYIRRRGLPHLTITISSPGGGAYYALALYDALKVASEAGIRVTACVEGWAASAAAMVVLQAADVRIAQPHARFLLHECRRWVFFSVERTSDLEDELKEIKALEEQILKIMASRCGRTVEEVLKLIRRKEVWFSASEALEWGLIDKVL
jgi:ATP-dependent Clp protease protease subunit